MEVPSFAVDDLLAEAAEREGLSDFGDPVFREGLGLLAQTIEQNTAHIRGLKRQRRRLLDLLCTRLRLIHAFRQNPAIEDSDIVRPIVLTGLPRSGTSALFNLLNTDPVNGGLLNWEALFPDPLPGSQPGDEDPRRAFLEDMYAKGREQNPEFMKKHFVSADTPEECVLAWQVQFAGVQMGYEPMFEPYGSWFRAQNLDRMYHNYRDFLAILDWRQPRERWLLKAPAHMWAIDSLFTHFPDACLVWGHRDPVQIVPSICSLTESLLEINLFDYSHVDMADFGHKVMNFYAESLERGLASRGALEANQVLDYGMAELIREPMALVERIYSHFDLPLSDTARQALKAHAEDNQQGKHGSHEYTLEQYGLSESIIRERFAFYLDDPRWRDYLS